MPFDERYEDPRAEHELEDAFNECMLADAVPRAAIDHAKSIGLDREQQLKAAVVALSHTLRRMYDARLRRPPEADSSA